MSDKWYISGPLAIGTTEPKAQLHIAGGDVGSTNFGDIKLCSIDPIADFAYTGGNDGVFWFVHHGKEDGATHFRNSNRDLLVIKNNGNVGIGTATPAGRLNISEVIGTPHSPNIGSLVIDHENVGGASSIIFRSKVNRTSDYGFIQFQDAATVGGAGESCRLIIGTNNDTDDHIALMPSGNVGIGTNDPKAKLEIVGDVRANKYCGLNKLPLNDYRTANPASNVYLYSQPNDRDSWLFLDSADTGSNWGIYHRQIDAPLNNFLPGNSIAFVGGGNSDLKAYVCLGDGSAYFKGSVKTSSLATESLNVQKELSCNGIQTNRVLASTGGQFHSIAIGESLGLGNDVFPWMYETIGTPSTNHNLRLFSRNWIVFHSGNTFEESGTMALDQSGQWHGSSRKLKYDICDLTGEQAMSALETLRPVTFLFHHDKSNTRRSGFIAEEVPAMVANKDHTMINQMDIIAILTRAVKEQQGMIRGILQDLSSRH